MFAWSDLDRELDDAKRTEVSIRRVLGRDSSERDTYLGIHGQIASKLLSDAKSNRRGKRTVRHRRRKHDTHTASIGFVVDNLNMTTANDFEGLQSVFMFRILNSI